jgi:SH3-like domain-containing protein
MFRYISIIISLAFFCVVATGPAAFAQKTLSVQVKEGLLRATPSHLGKITARTAYGAQVTVLEERGAWKRVAVAGGKTQGWMHNTALTGKKLVLKAGQAGVGTSVTRDEIALAGKGFSEEVEAQYRKSNKNLDYTWINRMEAMKVSPEQVEDFISAGRLTPGGEGGRP